MRLWLHKLEKIIDRLVPYCLALLVVIIVLELGFHEWVVEHELLLPIEIADYSIIGIFIVDLIFKYIRVRNIPQFLKQYWLEIIAVFPFFLIFRLAELIFELEEVSSGIKTVQSVTHSTSGIEKEVKVLTEAEKLLKVERSSRLTRFLRPLLRLPRFLKSVPRMTHFYDKPTGEHNPSDLNK